MSTIKPVTIPREVADAIEYLRTDEGGGSTYSNEMIALLYADITISGYAAVTLRKIPFDTLMRALLDGYERELTEEEAREKALDNIRSYYAWLGERERCEGVRLNGNPFEFIRAKAAIRITLNALGTEISGINDAEGGAA